MGQRGVAEAETTEVHDSAAPARAVSFAHESEREFAGILDFYRIRWEYEPRTFPLRWDAAGNPVESFTPDFYLVDHDLFIELTTLKQKLVTKKNRKLRLLRERYPEINIKLLYARDFRSLMEKYGLGASVP
jgi:hypoxanthine phosphoribosyltransferase